VNSHNLGGAAFTPRAQSSLLNREQRAGWLRIVSVFVWLAGAFVLFLWLARSALRRGR
jgi:hypothetical protein